MVFGFILNLYKKFSTNMPKSDTVAKNTKILLVKNTLKLEKVFNKQYFDVFCDCVTFRDIRTKLFLKI